ncbi:MAG TPA: hypothetical protein VL020_07975 [Pseudomonadales bacterium]|nr:hypothetical protein [Pseudomonadales bacterium]
MKEINEEIKQTINLMQAVNDECVYAAMQKHLNGLLEIKRNELQQRLVERSWLEPADSMGSVVKFDQAPYKSVKLEGQIAGEAKPLTADELMAGGWWCGDTGDGSLKAFLSLGFKTEGDIPWDGSYYACFIFESGSDLIDRGNEHHTFGLKQIHRIGHEFYWSEV